MRGSAEKTVRSRRRRKRRRVLRAVWPSAPLRRRWVRWFSRAPVYAQVATVLTALLMMWAVVNWMYQVVRKPTELFFPVSGVLHKTPAETWRAYAPIFRAHATATMTPALLAALAQVEGSGNPVARTYWRWALTTDPWDVYRPASSAVGMYQFTDATFAEARHYCIHDHHVVKDGPWHAWRSCWFNGLYSRVIPTHAVEMASAYLDFNVSRVLRRHGIRSATLGQKQNVAALMHLCGVGAANRYIAQHLRLTPDQHCGSHLASSYIARVTAMQTLFIQFAEQGL